MIRRFFKLFILYPSVFIYLVLLQCLTIVPIIIIDSMSYVIKGKSTDYIIKFMEYVFKKLDYLDKY